MERARSICLQRLPPWRGEDREERQAKQKQFIRCSEHQPSLGPLLLMSPTTFIMKKHRNRQCSVQLLIAVVLLAVPTTLHAPALPQCWQHKRVENLTHKMLLLLFSNRTMLKKSSTQRKALLSHERAKHSPTADQQTGRRESW